MIACVAFAAAALSALIRLQFGNYIFSALTSVFSGIAVAASGSGMSKWPMAAGLLVSVAGDWFLSHQNGAPNRFLYGVALFFAAHCLFSVGAAMKFRFNVPALVIGIVLVAGYAVYMGARVLPHVEAGMKIPLCLYALVSIVSLYFAMSMKANPRVTAMYILGIAAILFSDTMIAENIYLGSYLAGRLVHPTYYFCHLLLALSAHL